MQVRCAAIALAIFASLVAAAPSSGAVTIGNHLDTTGLVNSPGCNSADCTITTRPPTGTTTIEAPGGLLSPITGVVTSWRFASNSSGNQVSLKVLRPGTGLVATGAGTSTPHTSAGGINGPFPTQLPIRAGDGIGLNATPGALILQPNAQASSTYWNPSLPDGQTLTGTDAGSRQAMVEATVERDGDCDGRGDETQDSNLNDGPCGDHRPPSQTLFAKKRQKLSKAAISETLDQDGTVTMRATVKVPAGHHPHHLRVLAKAVGSKASTASLTANAATKIKLRFSRSARKKIKAAIHAAGPRKVLVTTTATDSIGNSSTAQARFKLVG